MFKDGICLFGRLDALSFPEGIPWRQLCLLEGECCGPVSTIPQLRHNMLPRWAHEHPQRVHALPRVSTETAGGRGCTRRQTDAGSLKWVSSRDVFWKKWSKPFVAQSTWHGRASIHCDNPKGVQNAKATALQAHKTPVSLRGRGVSVPSARCAADGVVALGTLSRRPGCRGTSGLSASLSWHLSPSEVG